MSCSNCGGCAGCLQGLGQTPSPAPTPSASSSWTPWVLGGVAAVAAAGLIYMGTRHAVPHEAFAENPTRKKTPGSYQQAIANMLMHRYGFSYNKAYTAVNDEEIGWKIAWFFQHNYNVSYATRMIHRRARRKLYGPWREAGYMPLGRPLPPVPGQPEPEVAPAPPPDEASLQSQYG